MNNKFIRYNWVSDTGLCALYSSNLLKQQFLGKGVSPLEHITRVAWLGANRSVLSPLYCMLSREATNYLFFSLWLDLTKDKTHDLSVTILHGSKIQLYDQRKTIDHNLHPNRTSQHQLFVLSSQIQKSPSYKGPSHRCSEKVIYY